MRKKCRNDNEPKCLINVYVINPKNNSCCTKNCINNSNYYVQKWLAILARLINSNITINQIKI